MTPRILAVDDEPIFLESLKRGLITAGYPDFHLESDPRSVLSTLKRGGDFFDVALIDVTMPEINGIRLLEEIKTVHPTTECIMITALDDLPTAVECMRKGAYDYLVKPISRNDLMLALERALEHRRLCCVLELYKGDRNDDLDHPDAFAPIVAKSRAMLKILKETELHAASDVTILVTGESGTGKELLARAIHAASPRRRRPFYVVNMASMTGTLFDAEFFGHTKGAFTGAEKERAGYLQNAHKGTLFLDEIGDLSLDLQGKLLRVIQEGEYCKLGTSRIQRVDVRFVAATQADLAALVKKGRFRKDLYYRLKGAWLHLPPLRERKEDVPILIRHMLAEIRETGSGAMIADSALDALLAYDYPGNVRELRSILQAASNLAQGQPLELGHLPIELRRLKPRLETKQPRESFTIIPLDEVEKEAILKAYRLCSGNKSQTARLLGIGLNTLRRKLRNFGVD